MSIYERLVGLLDNIQDLDRDLNRIESELDDITDNITDDSSVLDIIAGLISDFNAGIGTRNALELLNNIERLIKV